jgi:HEAT repeat protein
MRSIQRLKLTGAAILVSSSMKVWRAAPAAYPYRSDGALWLDGAMQQILGELEADPPDIEGVADRLVALAADRPEAVVSALLAIENPPLRVRQVLVKVLRDLAPEVTAGLPTLVRILCDSAEKEDTRVEAAAALGNHGPAAFAALATLCRDADPFVRDHAANELGNIGIYTDFVVETLACALSDPVRDVRNSAIRSLSRDRGGTVVPGLTRLLAHAEPVGRIGAAHALLALDPRNPAALRTAIAGLESETPTTRALACDALAVAKEEARPAVMALCHALTDEDAAVRSRAAYALQELRDAGRGAVKALGKALDDPCRDVRDWSGLALMRLGPAVSEAADDVMRALRRRVEKASDSEDPERFFLVYLVRSVGNLGTAARAALPTLKEAERIVADIAEQQALVAWAIRRCLGKA